MATTRMNIPRSPKRLLLAVKKEMAASGGDLEGLVAEYGNWETVEIDDHDGDICVTGEAIKGWLWLGEDRIRTFLTWLNDQVYFDILEAWVERSSK